MINREIPIIARHRKFRDEVLGSLKRITRGLPEGEVLAIYSYTLGQLVAIQKTVSVGEALKIIQDNIAAGAQAIVDEAANSNEKEKKK